MEQKELLMVKNAMDNAKEDTKPVIGVLEDGVVVQGDVNNTKIEPKTYTAMFVFPEHMLKEVEGAKPAKDGYATIEIEYKDVFPNAMNNLKYTSAMTQLLPFYNDLKEDGTIEPYDSEAVIRMFQKMGDEAIEALYRVVKVVLGIDDALIGHLAPIGEHGAVVLASQIMEDFPSLVNQADLFLESSTEKV